MYVSEFMEFVKIPYEGKTEKFEVQNKDRTAILGYIKWYGAWRKYCFFPEPNTIFDAKCLLDVTKFIAELMFIRSAKKVMQS